MYSLQLLSIALSIHNKATWNTFKEQRPLKIPSNTQHDILFNRYCWQQVLKFGTKPLSFRLKFDVKNKYPEVFIHFFFVNIHKSFSLVIGQFTRNTFDIVWSQGRVYGCVDCWWFVKDQLLLTICSCLYFIVVPLFKVKLHLQQQVSLA